MFTIRLIAPDLRPDLVVTVRTAADGWETEHAGDFSGDSWRFLLDEDSFGGGIEFKFVLDHASWMLGENLRAPAPAAGDELVYRDVRFPPLEVLVENPSVAQRFFWPSRDEDRLWDAVIVGSGIGGGILADQLSDLGADVLVLEAGSYLFPTHVGNLPRRLTIGRFDKHVWRLWYDFKVVNYVNGPGSIFAGGQGINLGGRSLFWGGLTPRMTSWELDAWPPAVKAYLEQSGYRVAETLMHARELPTSPYQEDTRVLLRTLLPEWDHLPAAMAVQYQGPTATSIPTGLFSTADLLLESRLTDAEAGARGLTVNLNHPVVRVLTDGRRASGVVAHDLIANVDRTFHGRHLVLACGTIETARLALASRLTDPNGLIGAGITDHPIFFTHFAIPASAPHYEPGGASKTLSRFRHAGVDDHPYNLVVELGADFNQGRYIDEDLLAEHRAATGPFMLSELVFMLNTPLVAGNRVTQPGPPPAKPVLTFHRADVSDALRAELRAVQQQVIGGLGGVALAGEGLDLHEADLGGVAHEVGTMRMAADDSGVVDAELRIVGYDNLYVCDLSVFPTSPAANPTLTLGALAIRLAELLAHS